VTDLGYTCKQQTSIYQSFVVVLKNILLTVQLRTKSGAEPNSCGPAIVQTENSFYAAVD